MPKFAELWYRSAHGTCFVKLDGKQIDLEPIPSQAFGEERPLIEKPKRR